MDNYGELSFQNAVDCLPLNVHLGHKSAPENCDELVRVDEHAEFKITFNDISVGGVTTIDDNEVSLGDVIVQQSVASLDHSRFIYSTPDASIPISVRTENNSSHENAPNLPQPTLHIIDNGPGEIIHVTHHPAGLEVIENSTSITSHQVFHESSSLCRRDEQISQVNATNGSEVKTESIQDESSSNFSILESVQPVSDKGIGCAVEHDIENILNTVPPSSDAVFTEGEKLDSSSSLSQDTAQRGKHNNKSKSDERHECKICGKTFREKSHLATHSRAHVNIRNYNCEVCGLRFKTKTNLCFHFQTHSETPFTCTECNKTFSERKILKRHIRVVHSCKELHKCNQCDKSFKSAAILSLHYTLHTGNKPFRCSLCPKSFVYKSTLAMHINQYHQCTSCLPSSCRHRTRSWLCTVCGKGYSLKATLNTHMKTHDPDKLFKCSECPKTFVKKQSYEMHMKLHTGEGPQYMCDQCSQSYFNVFALRRHYMKHTSQRNFICEVCKKAFWMKDALKVHMRSHSNEKPFQCSRCPKAFAHKHTLEGHMKTHRANQEQQTISDKEFHPSITAPITPIQHSESISQPYLFYQLPPAIQPASHIVLPPTDQNPAQTLHVL